MTLTRNGFREAGEAITICNCPGPISLDADLAVSTIAGGCLDVIGG